ncbi:MAG: hypothetical protein QG635_1147, partial [Bacteroidota bacterium]|nr:hypothetical protein [Bacteroidota bacterium]
AKVIIYSGVADSSVRSVAKDYGVYEFFFKPIDWLYFAEKLVELETEKDYIS